MKYIEGVTLKDKLKKFRPTYREMLPIIEDVGSALTYAHELGIVHRDVKPSNVLISKEGKIYLTDFGLARMAQVSTTTLTSDQMIGTPQYISPEQATSSPNLDYRTDIYSFGVLIYEMVVGQVPYNADTPFAIIHDHIYTPLPLPSILNPNCPESIEKVLIKALAKDPAERYKDVNTMVRAFRGAIRQLEGTQVAETQIPVEKNKNQPDQQAYRSSLPVIENIDSGKKENSFIPKPRKSTPKIRKRIVINRKWWIIIGSVIAGIVLLAISISVFSNLKNVPEAPILSTEPPGGIIEPITGDAPGDARAAQTAWLKAMLYWQHDDYISMDRLLNAASISANSESQILDKALQYFYAHEAWLPTAKLMLAINQTSEGGTNLMEDSQAHQAIFMAGDDQLSNEFFIQNSNNPLFSIGSIRYQLKFGDINRVGAELDRLSQETDIDTIYPELRLVKAEYFIKNGTKPDARNIIEPMMDDPNLPEWVRLFARQIYPLTRY
jgi:serine/threonine protein kinase